MLRAVLVLTALFTLACAAAPESGTYDVDFLDASTDCEDEEATKPDDTEWDVQVDDDGAQIEIDEVRCPLDGMAFECVLLEEEFDAPDFDMTMTTTQLLVGEWVSSTAIEGELVTTAACEGDGCPDDYGCSSTVTFEADLEE